MAAPGSLRGRYEQLAGPAEKRRELYIARVKLGYTIDEWLALPWWQRKLYVEQMIEEADAREQESAGRRPGQSSGGGLMSPLDALYDGDLADVAASTAFDTGR